MPKILEVGDEPKPLRSPVTPSKGKPAGKRTKHSSSRFASINAFIDATMAGLSRTEIAVWLILWRDTKPEGTVRTSQADMARRSGVDTRTVRRALTRLNEAGLLTKVYAGGLNRGPSVYRVHAVPP
jgi:hypothetical protein